jgi:hypothetical protein
MKNRGLSAFLPAAPFAMPFMIACRIQSGMPFRKFQIEVEGYDHHRADFLLASTELPEMVHKTLSVERTLLFRSSSFRTASPIFSSV